MAKPYAGLDVSLEMTSIRIQVLKIFSIRPRLPGVS